MSQATGVQGGSGGGGSAAKLCSGCGNDCTGKPRTRDQSGRYWCADCVRRMKQERKRSESAAPTAAAAATATSDDAGYDLDEVAPPEPQAAAALGKKCPKCSFAMGPQATICVSCGYNARTGVRATTEGIDAKRGRAVKCRKCGYDLSGLPGGKCPECGSARGFDTRTDAQRAESKRLARWMYLTPLIMLLVGVPASCVIFSLMVGTPAAALGYLIILGVNLVLGVAVYLLCSLMWIGFDESILVIVLRLAGIYAVTDAVNLGLTALGIPFIPWAVSVVVYIALLTQIMEIEMQDALFVALITWLARFVTMLVLGAMLRDLAGL